VSLGCPWNASRGFPDTPDHLERSARGVRRNRTPRDGPLYRLERRERVDFGKDGACGVVVSPGGSSKRKMSLTTTTRSKPTTSCPRKIPVIKIALFMLSNLPMDPSVEG
jgi:hypothetical protein